MTNYATRRACKVNKIWIYINLRTFSLERKQKKKVI